MASGSDEDNNHFNKSFSNLSIRSPEEDEEHEAQEEDGREKAEELRRSKRERKPPEWYRPTGPVKRKIKIPKGIGLRLGDIPRISKQIQETTGYTMAMSRLHTFLFGQVTTNQKTKKANLRNFNGFEVDGSASEYMVKLMKFNGLKPYGKGVIDSFCALLNLKDVDPKNDKRFKMKKIVDFLFRPSPMGTIEGPHTEEDPEPDPAEVENPEFPSDADLQRVAKQLTGSALRNQISIMEWISRVVEQFEGVDLTNKEHFIKCSILQILHEHFRMAPHFEPAGSIPSFHSLFCS